MSRARKLVEGALRKLDEASARADEAALARLTPAERERYDDRQARTAAITPGGAATVWLNLGGLSNVRASVERHDELIGLCAAGDAEGAAGVAYDTFHGLPVTETGEG